MFVFVSVKISNLINSFRISTFTSFIALQVCGEYSILNAMSFNIHFYQTRLGHVIKPAFSKLIIMTFVKLVSY